jgi:hypothetical protein
MQLTEGRDRRKEGFPFHLMLSTALVVRVFQVEEPKQAVGTEEGYEEPLGVLYALIVLLV